MKPASALSMPPSETKMTTATAKANKTRNQSAPLHKFKHPFHKAKEAGPMNNRCSKMTKPMITIIFSNNSSSSQQRLKAQLMNKAIASLC